MIIIILCLLLENRKYKLHVHVGKQKQKHTCTWYTLEIRIKKISKFVMIEKYPNMEVGNEKTLIADW